VRLLPACDGYPAALLGHVWLCAAVSAIPPGRPVLGVSLVAAQSASADLDATAHRVRHPRLRRRRLSVHRVCHGLPVAHGNTACTRTDTRERFARTEALWCVPR